MKIAANIAGALLGLLFLAASVPVLLHLGPEQAPPPPESLPGKFMGALAPSGYLVFIKVCELLGGILVAIPKTRNFGLLVLGPVIVNILAFHIFLTGGASLHNPPAAIMTGAAVALSLFLVWTDRKRWAALRN